MGEEEEEEEIEKNFDEVTGYWEDRACTLWKHRGVTCFVEYMQPNYKFYFWISFSFSQVQMAKGFTVRLF